MRDKIIIEITVNKDNTFKTPREDDYYAYYCIVNDVPYYGDKSVTVRFVYKDKIVYEGVPVPSSRNSNKDGKHTVALFFNSKIRSDNMCRAFTSNNYSIRYSGKSNIIKEQKPYTGRGGKTASGHVKSVNSTNVCAGVRCIMG